MEFAADSIVTRATPTVRAAPGSFSDELADKGFLVTTIDDVIQWGRTGSLMWMQFGLACCAIEMI